MDQVKKMMERSDDYWHVSARSFDAQYHSGVFARAFLRRRTQILLRMVKLDSSCRLADVGCGSAVQMAELASQAAEVVGFDYSAQMVELARERLATLGVTNATVRQCDAYRLEAPDKTFDTVISMGLLDYLDAPERAIREMSRVSKDTATIVFTVPKRPSLFAFLRSGLGLYIREKIFDLPPIHTVLRRSEVHQLAVSAGFEIVELVSIWTTMWVVRLRKASSSAGTVKMPTEL